MPPHFLSCDWGTSHFRLRLVDSADLTVVEEIKTNEGAAYLASQATPENRADLFAETLRRHIGAIFERTEHRAAACVVSGMASSSIGWMDLPYAKAPLPLEPSHFISHRLTLPVGPVAVEVTLISGVCTDNDVMRGEECELYGLLELHPELGTARTCVLLPGTHSKHVYFHGRNLERFSTYMTGEVFTHLREMPTLRALLSVEGPTSTPDFCEGVLAARKSNLLAGLFKIRTQALLSPQRPLHSPSFLSGLLIGNELLDLGGATGTDVFLAGSPTLHPLYLLAAEQIEFPLRSISPDILQQSLLHAHSRFLTP